MSEAIFLLDADSFIRAKRQHYGFDFCPGYWDALLRSYRSDLVFSIEPVRKELEKGNDDLKGWLTEYAPEDFFASVENEDVQDAFAEVIRSVQANPQYKEAARQKFASGADPWLVAYAKVFEYIIATYEVAAPESKSKVKLPDVAAEFDVDCIPPYEMLRNLKVVLVLKK